MNNLNKIIILLLFPLFIITSEAAPIGEFWGNSYFLKSCDSIYLKLESGRYFYIIRNGVTSKHGRKKDEKVEFIYFKKNNKTIMFSVEDDLFVINASKGEFDVNIIISIDDLEKYLITKKIKINGLLKQQLDGMK